MVSPSIDGNDPEGSVAASCERPTITRRRPSSLRRSNSGDVDSAVCDEYGDLLPPDGGSRGSRRASFAPGTAGPELGPANNRSGGRRRSSLLSLTLSDTDISAKQDGPILLPDRESHTADLGAFDRYVEQVAGIERDSLDSEFSAPFWAFLRSKLEEFGQPIGYGPQDPSGPDKIVHKGPEDNMAFITKKFALDAFSPINPAAVSDMAGIDLDVVLTELTYATTVGMVTVKFSPECDRCGGAVCEEDFLGAIANKSNRKINCAGCQEPNAIHSIDKIAVVFFLHPEVLFVLADGFGCKPSQAGIANCAMPIAVVPGTTTGSGFRYSVGCGGPMSLGDPLPKGRYRMHCPIARTDNYLEVLGDAPNPEERVGVRAGADASDSSDATSDGEEDCGHALSFNVSDLQFGISNAGGRPSSPGERKTITVPHGAVHFDITPDTNSLFALWVQRDTPDEQTIFGLPSEERIPYTGAGTILNNPTFDRLLRDTARLFATRSFLEMGSAVLVFTDIVGSTDMYAELGDIRALALVDRHFEVLFSAFGKYGRVVKTIGDAAMASFPTGRAAIKGVAAALANVGNSCGLPNGRRLQIRVGIHKGPAVVVPLNGINDYFGQTVNLASRVEGKAAANTCLVTNEVLSDPDAAAAYEEILGDEDVDFVGTPEEELTLKGIKGTVFVKGFKLREEGC